MTTADTLLQQAKATEFFVAPYLERDLARFLDEKAMEIRQLASESVRGDIREVYFVASGASGAALYSGMYLLQRYTSIAAHSLPGYDFINRGNVRVNEHSLVFLASYGGRTEDTLAALRFAKGKRARTIAIGRRQDPATPIMSEADVRIEYDSPALYHIPLAAVYLFGSQVALATNPGQVEMRKLADDLFTLPSLLGEVYKNSQTTARDLAERCVDSKLMYVLGTGPLYGLAYTYALTIFMEYLRINSSVIEASEFRQGPIEALSRQKADLVFLVGTDETRAMMSRVLDVVRTRTDAQSLVFDMADYAPTSPLLAPLVLHIPLQWFTVYSAVLRGFADLDTRTYMGTGLLSKEGATWP